MTDEVQVGVPVFPEAARAAIDADYAELERLLEHALGEVRARRRDLQAVFALADAEARRRPLAGMFVRIRPGPTGSGTPPGTTF